MRQAAGLVFDEIISTTASATTYGYTSTELNEFLAKADQMSIQVVVDDCTIPNGVTLQVSAQVETSADGMNWATKNASPEVAPFTVSTSATTVSPFSYDDGALPTLRFARLRVLLQASPLASTSAHVRVYATLRDSGGYQHAPLFAVQGKPVLKPQNDADVHENPHVHHQGEWQNPHHP